MRRRELLLAGLAVPAWALAARAQQPAGAPARIGYLHPQSEPRGTQGASVFETFRDELTRLGFVEGQNVAYERRFADGDATRLAALAEDLVRKKVDVIVAQTTTGALAAKRATATIPIVFTSSGDAVGSGLVASLARPGGNATGNSFLGTELAVKQLELLRELLPAARRVALVGNSTLPPEPLFFGQMQEPARRLGFEAVFVDARSPDDFGRAAAELRDRKVQAAIWAPGGYTDGAADRARLLQAVEPLAMPTMYFRREFVEGGGLVAFGPSFPDLYRKAAEYVARILRGEHPANLPVQQPTTFELVVNLKAAKALGIAVPESIQARADEVIE